MIQAIAASFDNFFDANAKCDVLVIACMDNRFWPIVLDYVSNNLKVSRYDLSLIPGGIQAIVNKEEVAMKAVNLAVTAHHVKRILLFNHVDCGAYGGKKKFDHDHGHETNFHSKDLLAAKSIIDESHPGREVTTFFISHCSKNHNIEILSVEE